LSNFATQPFKPVGVLKSLAQSGNYYPMIAVGPLDAESK
jgi:hypothetical protein